MKHRIAFSLIELVICIGLVVIAILGSVALIISLLRSSQKSTDLTTGSAVASSILTQQIYNILDGTGPVTKANFFSLDAPPQPPISGTMPLSGTVFTYNIYYQTLNDTGGGTIGQGLAGNRVKKVDITVWWWTPTPTTTRQGYGVLSTGLSRLVNEASEF